MKKIVETDNKMRDEFHTLIEKDGKFFIQSEGNVFPSRMGTCYFLVSKKVAKKISTLSVDEAWKYMNEYSAINADEFLISI